MNKEAFDLAANLLSINKLYEGLMKKSIENYEALAPASLKEITLGLIAMDRDQIGIASVCALEREHKRRQVAKAIAHDRRQSQIEKSAWFGGEYDERTYY